MKIFKKVLLAIGFILLFMDVKLNVFAATNPYQKYLSWGGINCTWYAWQKAYDTTGVALMGFVGNARDWYSAAEKNGYTVGSEPRANSIVVWDNFESGGVKYGHVGFVERVEGETIYYWDSVCVNNETEGPEYDAYIQCLSESINEETSNECLKLLKRIPCAASGRVGDDALVGYIYVEIPRKVVAQPKKETQTSTNTAPKETKKSDNNYLSELHINEVELDFKKDVMEYKIEVPYEINKITFQTLAEDKTASVKLDDEYPLEVGENKISITVTSESGKTRDYVIEATRLEEIKEESVIESSEEKVSKNKTNKKNNKFTAIIFFSIGAFIVIVITVLFIIINKHKKTLKNKQ